MNPSRSTDGEAVPADKGGESVATIEQSAANVQGTDPSYTYLFADAFLQAVIMVGIVILTIRLERANSERQWIAQERKGLSESVSLQLQYYDNIYHRVFDLPDDAKPAPELVEEYTLAARTLQGRIDVAIDSVERLRLDRKSLRNVSEMLAAQIEKSKELVAYLHNSHRQMEGIIGKDGITEARKNASETNKKIKNTHSCIYKSIQDIRRTMLNLKAAVQDGE